MLAIGVATGIVLAIVVVLAVRARAAALARQAEDACRLRFCRPPVRWSAVEVQQLRVAAAPDPALDGVDKVYVAPGDPPWAAAMPRRGPELAAILGETLASVAPYVWKAATIDPAVFAAVSQLTHQAVSSLGSLADATKHWPGLGVWGSSVGVVTKLRGHVGEFMAAEHLRNAGHGVRMEAASNAEGMDLWVDGHPMNVKTTLDASRAAHAALRAHPDVGVIVAGDAEHISDGVHFSEQHAINEQMLGQEHIFIDDSLSVHDATSATQDALDAAGGQVDVHVPWITAARSSFREFELLNAGKTDLGRAAKNVAVDTAVMGGGAKAGAVLGAKIGTLFGPGLGTAVGAVIGGVVGGKVGSGVARDIREQPLRDARTAYDAAARTFEAKRTEIVEAAVKTWDARVTCAHRELAGFRRTADDSIRDVVSKAVAETARATKLQARAREAMLTAAQAAAGRELDTARRRVADLSRWDRLWPEREFTHARAALPYLEAEVAQLASLEGTTTRNDDATFLTALSATTAGISLVEQHARRISAFRVAALRDVEQRANGILARLASQRATLVETLTEEHARMIDETTSHLRRAAEPASAARGLLEKEMRKAGMEVG